MLRRYRDARTFTASDGSMFSSRYRRMSKDIPFFVITTTVPVSLDLLSVRHYNTPLLYWAIQDLNDIIDPMVTIPAGKQIKIPLL